MSEEPADIQEYALIDAFTGQTVRTFNSTKATGKMGLMKSTYRLDFSDFNQPGTYYLKETKAPAGYNKLTSPIKVTITKTGDEEWTVSKDGTVEDDKIIDIENSTGSLLPSTGGRGAIAFAVIAALLVFGVAVSFIRDKRKEA